VEEISGLRGAEWLSALKNSGALLANRTSKDLAFTRDALSSAPEALHGSLHEALGITLGFAVACEYLLDALVRAGIEPP
jgi:hypothetical protein